MAKSQLQWNVRLGPLRLSSPVGIIGGAFLIGILCCCGSSLIFGMFTDSDPKPSPVLTTPVATASPAAGPEETASAPPKLVTAGAFCDHVGDRATTKSGTPMVCKGPGDLRWRKR